MSQSDFVTRGQALVSSGQYQEAVKVCRLGLLGRPTTVEGRIVLGQALLALKRYDEVLAEMRVALELDHASTAAQQLRGEAMLRKGDGHGALDVLGKLREHAAGSPQLAGLIAEAERLVGRAPPGVAPARAPGAAMAALVSDAAEFANEAGTKHYPKHAEAADGTREGGGSEYTRPTSIAASAPGGKTGSKPRVAVPGPVSEAMPSPAVLAVGDRSGTVEVDPEIDGVEMRDDDLGEVVGPPVGGKRRSSSGKAGKAGKTKARNGRVSPNVSAMQAAIASRKPQHSNTFKEENSTVELGDDEMEEVEDDVNDFDGPEGRTESRTQREARTERDGREAKSRSSGRRVPGPGTAVRNAVKIPSGPIDLPASALPPPSMTKPLPAAPAPSHLAQLIANQPNQAHQAHQAQMSNAAPPVPLPPPPHAEPSARSQLAASLPTVSAMQAVQPIDLLGSPHGPAGGMSGPSRGKPASQPPSFLPPQFANQQPPMLPSSTAIGPQFAPSGQPGQLPQLFGSSAPQVPTQIGPHHVPHASSAPPASPYSQLPTQLGLPPPQSLPQPAPLPAMTAQQYSMQQLHSMQDLPAHLQTNLAASRPTMAMAAPSGPQAPTRAAIDPRFAATMIESGGVPALAPAVPSSAGSIGHADAHVRKRSPLRLAIWVMVGAAVIGGGVFAGFQIRSLRLGRQIDAARERATAQAKADTWDGWSGARDSLYSIAQASPTPDNKAALARARALVAYEFGDGAADAKAAVDAVANQSSLDADLAAAYLALAQSDGKAARTAADRALHTAPEDAAALYVSGQAALLAGDAKAAIAALRHAIEREARPLYAAGLGRALGQSTAWDEVLAAVDKPDSRDNPAAVLARAAAITASGRASTAQLAELRAQLAKLVADAGKPGSEPARVSPMQVAQADLALAQLDAARGDLAAARTDYRAALAVNLGDQRFAEDLTEALSSIGEFDVARKSANLALTTWPTSRRARVALAQLAIAAGKPADALEVLKSAEATSWPRGLTVRGQAELASGDTAAAGTDFDAALKKLPGYEPALIARAWLDLAGGDAEGARQRLEPRASGKSPSPALVAAYAAALRAGKDPAAKTKAKALIEQAAASSFGPDAARLQLELARSDRDAGDLRAAVAAYAEASRAGSAEARLEAGAFQIEMGDPRGGTAVLEQLIRDAGDHPSAALLVEAARARTLTGQRAGAAELLAQADKAPGAVRWQIDRERGRLALGRGDTPAAAQALTHALDGCGSDADSFLLAADTVALDDKQTQLAGQLKALAAKRLAGRPELDIITAKLDLAATPKPRLDEAEKLYAQAHAALDKEHATQRRRAQADFGSAAVHYYKQDDPNAASDLQLVLVEDPTLADAYLFAAEIAKAKDPKKALEHAQLATSYNPDSLIGWAMVGELAAQTGNRRLLNDAINRVGELAPASDALHALQKLR